MKVQSLLLLAICLLFVTAVFSQSGIYIRFDGIPGDQTGIHNGEFLVTSFETTDTSDYHLSSSGTGQGKTYFGLAKLQKPLVPKANPTFMLYTAGGGGVRSATITCYNSSDVAYYQIVLTNVVFQSLSILSPARTGTDCNALYEEMHLGYSAIQWKDPVSGFSKGWDVARNHSF